MDHFNFLRDFFSFFLQGCVIQTVIHVQPVGIYNQHKLTFKWLTWSMSIFSVPGATYIPRKLLVRRDRSRVRGHHLTNRLPNLGHKSKCKRSSLTSYQNNSKESLAKWYYWWTTFLNNRWWVSHVILQSKHQMVRSTKILPSATTSIQIWQVCRILPASTFPALPSCSLFS